MHSISSPEPAEDGEVSKLNCETPVKKVSVQAQLPSKFFNERLATPRVRSLIYVDEARPLRYRRPSGRPRLDRHTKETEVLVSAGNRRKPWPSRKGAEVEELVKYMSSVPCYLQRIEKGDNVQEKALNFGVIEWRRVEKWTSSQKIDQKNLVSCVTNMVESPSLYTNQSCPYSGRSNSSSPVQWKQTSCRSRNNSPAEMKPTFSVDGHGGCSDELKSSYMSHSPKSRTSPASRSLWSSHENFPHSKHEYRTSMQTEAASSMEKEKPKTCEHQSSNHDGRIPNKRLETNFLEHGCVLDHLSEISCAKCKTLVGVHGDRKAMEVCNNCPGKLPQKYSVQSSVSGDLLQSVILSAMFQNEKSKMLETALPTKKGVPATKFLTKNTELYQIGKSSGNYMHDTDDKAANQKFEGINGGTKEPLPKHPSSSGLKWLNRSSSLKDVPFSHQLKDKSALDIYDDKGRSNSRGRRSPLRRILDPLLKSKYDGNSGPIASSPIHRPQEHRINIRAPSEQESTSMYTMHKSSDASVIGSSNTQMPSAPQGLLQEEKYGAKMRQALVKLAWKNGQPLFMFSTNDNSVLVASMRRTDRLGKEDSAGIYTIVTAQESKKKSGIWIGQSWNRKPNLLYDVVGRMEVSCSKLSSFDSKNLEVSRQFVLVIDEPLPNQGCIDSVHSSQLAAIIVKAPYKKLNGSICNVLSRDSDYENLAQDKHSSLYIESLQVEKYPEYSRACSISAILSSGIHGFSELGKPSTIIERWKSGGSCDCGGWDEGCRLTVLADRPHEMKVDSSVQECPTNDGFRRLELFVQGRKTENKYGFSMMAFKEGLYTVEFGSSITSLQAFAICIATLHSRSSIDVMDYSAKHKSLEDPVNENHPKRNSMQDNGGPTSYQPHHPPFSPVGRS